MTPQRNSCQFPSVLVVEDNDDSRLVLSLALEAIQVEHRCLSRGEQVLETVEQRYPSLILLDIALPDINGLLLVRSLKASAKTLAIPIIAITALATDGCEQQIIAAGCDGYLSKPFLLDDLYSLIAQYLPPPADLLHPPTTAAAPEFDPPALAVERA
ncbi:MAG: response regulator [Leptolyngbya sp. SIO4C1]|nr:response regulator [Leptolyngbya sp. SIO4C1]